MDAEQLLARANRMLKIKRQKTPEKSSLIEMELQRFFSQSAKPAKRNEAVPQAFEQAAGENLAQNCRIESMTAGILKVRVSPGPYMFELQTRSKEIIEKIKQQCPSARIRGIKIICSE